MINACEVYTSVMLIPLITGYVLYLTPLAMTTSLKVLPKPHYIIYYIIDITAAKTGVSFKLRQKINNTLSK